MISPTHQRERGQTILLVAVSIVTLLAMAALAIDVVTLYAARTEMQRAADAAALAAAKAFVDSGVTTVVPTDPNYASVQTLAQNMATAVVNAIVLQNKVAGVAPTLAAAPAFNFTQQGNPQISVTLQRTNLPIFFARIWGSRLATVTASATAEAYNPSNSQTATGSYIPITPKCVKPLLVPNADPHHNPPTSSPFIDRVTGQVAAGVVAEAFQTPPMQLSPACPAGGTCINLPFTPTVTFGGPLPYLPAQVTSNSSNLCPACQGAATFEQSIECCDFNVTPVADPRRTQQWILTSTETASAEKWTTECLV